MSNKEVTLICTCGSRTFSVTPDGAASYVIGCCLCGKYTEISVGRGMTLTLVDVSDEPAAPQP